MAAQKQPARQAVPALGDGPAFSLAARAVRRGSPCGSAPGRAPAALPGAAGAGAWEKRARGRFLQRGIVSQEIKLEMRCICFFFSLWESQCFYITGEITTRISVFTEQTRPRSKTSSSRSRAVLGPAEPGGSPGCLRVRRCAGSPGRANAYHHHPCFPCVVPLCCTNPRLREHTVLPPARPAPSAV